MKVRFEMTINTGGKQKKYYPIISFRDNSPISLKDRIMAHIKSVEKNSDYIIDGYMVEGGEVWQRDV